MQRLYFWTLQSVYRKFTLSPLLLKLRSPILEQNVTNPSAPMNRGMASHERERERDTRERRTGDRTDRRISRPSRNSQTSVRSTTVSSGHSGVLMVGPNFRVGKKIGCGNFGELRLGEPTWVLAVLPAIYCIHTAPHHTHVSHIHTLCFNTCLLSICIHVLSVKQLVHLHTSGLEALL